MKQYTVNGMSCAACSARVEKAVKALDGARDVSVNLLTGDLRVEGVSAEAVVAAVKKAVREELTEHGISHTTVECERTDEICPELCCEPAPVEQGHHHHHHGHHHHHHH